MTEESDLLGPAQDKGPTVTKEAAWGNSVEEEAKKLRAKAQEVVDKHLPADQHGSVAPVQTLREFFSELFDHLYGSH